MIVSWFVFSNSNSNNSSSNNSNNNNNNNVLNTNHIDWLGGLSSEGGAPKTGSHGAAPLAGGGGGYVPPSACECVRLCEILLCEIV